jgi:uncharacterized protein YkwD
VFKILFCILLLVTTQSFAGGSNSSPLAKYSDNWNSATYKACNTAASASYLTAAEKEIIYIINLVRQNPQLFAQTVLKSYPEEIDKNSLRQSGYYKSLMATLENMTPQKILKPDLIAYASANCHATSSGKTGYTGHQRQTDECQSLKNFMGECCDYGNHDPLRTVLTLLIDEGISSLGHRKILLGNYSAIGVSIMPHKDYGRNTVIDLR